MPMEEVRLGLHMGSSDTAAAGPTVTIRGFSISEMLECEKKKKKVHLRTDESVC